MAIILCCLLCAVSDHLQIMYVIPAFSGRQIQLAAAAAQLPVQCTGTVLCPGMEPPCFFFTLEKVSIIVAADAMRLSSSSDDESSTKLPRRDLFLGMTPELQGLCNQQFMAYTDGVETKVI